MAEHQRDYPVTTMCRALEVSVSGYYAWRKREPSQHCREDAELADKICVVFQSNRCVYGSPRIHAELQAQGHLLQQDFHADQPNQKWTTDTTYIWTQEGWLYLAVVLDLFSRMVVGWSMAAIQDATLVVNALEMALARRRPQAGLLHHSDRGSTYTSESYLALLQHNTMTVSMSRTANCYDNAVTEAFFHSFKGECSDHESFQSRAQARNCTFEYIETFYNRTRRHSTLQYMSPVMYEQLMC